MSLGSLDSLVSLERKRGVDMRVLFLFFVVFRFGSGVELDL